MKEYQMYTVRYYHYNPRSAWVKRQNQYALVLVYPFPLTRIIFFRAYTLLQNKVRWCAAFR